MAMKIFIYINLSVSNYEIVFLSQNINISIYRV